MKIRSYERLLDERKILQFTVKEEYEYAFEDTTSLNPEKIVNMVNALFGLNKRAEEYLYVLTFLGSTPTGVFEISHGTVDQALIHPADIFKCVLATGAQKFLMVHNHPSGHPEPSRVDLNLTERIHQGASILGLILVDHIIVGDSYFSFRENGMLKGGA